MKKTVLKTYGKIITSIFSFLGMIFGFSNCDKIVDSPAEYGCPSADYIIKGTVANAVDSTPIEKIQVIIPFDSTRTYLPDTTYTDENGDYKFQFKIFPLSKGIKVVANDTDSTANGDSFKSDTIEVEFTSYDLIEKGTGWYDGTYEKDNQDFFLNPEKTTKSK